MDVAMSFTLTEWFALGDFIELAVPLSLRSGHTIDAFAFELAARAHPLLRWITDQPSRFLQ